MSILPYKKRKENRQSQEDGGVVSSDDTTVETSSDTSSSSPDPDRPVSPPSSFLPQHLHIKQEQALLDFTKQEETQVGFGTSLFL